MIDNLEKISSKRARRLALMRQGLMQKEAFGKGIEATFAAIAQLSYLQIDTISVINRTHHHVIWTRVPTYQKEHLHQLLATEKRIFEYWSHAAAYLPIEDYRYSLPKKYALAAGEKHWFKRDEKLKRDVLDRIRDEGPLQARDFKAPKSYKKTEMWDWKPSKIALEHLFMEGELMIKERKGFQKVFDLTERVLPAGIDTSLPSELEMAKYLALRCIDAHGLATPKEMGYLRKSKRKKALPQALEELCEAGKIQPVKFEDEVYFSRGVYLEKGTKSLRNRQLFLLSPFDNLVIQRNRLKRLFDFDYQIECYVPAPKRKYGYFVLPILWGDQMVARLDPKADKKQKKLFIRNLVFEDHFKADDAFLSALASKLKALALFNDCEKLRVEKAPLGVGEVLEHLFKK